MGIVGGVVRYLQPVRFDNYPLPLWTDRTHRPLFLCLPGPAQRGLQPLWKCYYPLPIQPDRMQRQCLLCDKRQISGHIQPVRFGNHSYPIHFDIQRRGEIPGWKRQSERDSQCLWKYRYPLQIQHDRIRRRSLLCVGRREIRNLQHLRLDDTSLPIQFYPERRETISGGE